MSLAHLEAFDLIAHAEHIEQRLGATLEEIAKDDALAEERSWLETVRRRLVSARSSADDLLVRALRLPELEPLRGDRIRVLQTAVVEKVEQLGPAIVKAVARSPLVEILYRNLKPPAMVRATRETFEGFCDEIERRLGSSYVARMLADESYASVAPAIDAFRQAVADWRDLAGGTELPDDAASALRAELETVASRVDLPLRQARLIAEAALISRPGLLALSNLLDKPKRRAARVGASD